MSHKAVHTRPTLEKAEWSRKAVELHVRGWSIRRIAEKLNRSKTTVADAITAEFARVKLTDDDLRMKRGVLLEKLELREAKLVRLIGKYMPAAQVGDINAAAVVINADKALDRVHASIAKLEGLNAREQIDLSGGITLTATAHDELLNRLARLASEGEEGSDSSEPEP